MDLINHDAFGGGAGYFLVGAIFLVLVVVVIILLIAIASAIVLIVLLKMKKKQEKLEQEGQAASEAAIEPQESDYSDNKEDA